MRPKPRRALALLLVAVPLLAGCVILDPPDPNRVLAGRVDGTSPTNQYLKVHLVNDTGYRALANFDRRDWYVSGLEREMGDARIEYASVQGQDRDLLNEVVVRTVLSPEGLNAYRYEAMEQRAVAEGRPFDKAALDAEWDARLAERGLAEPSTGGVTGPVPLDATSTLP